MPTDEDVTAFLQAEVRKPDGGTYQDKPKRSEFIENGEDELRDPANRAFVREVMGQAPLIEDACEFSHRHPGWNVKVKFLHPSAWFDDVRTSVPSNGGPVVALIGDGWASYFRSQRSLVGDPVRLTWDLRLLYYRRDQLRSLGVGHDTPAYFRTIDSFMGTALALRAKGFVPLGVSTTADPDLLWGWLVPALWNAGGDIITQRGAWSESGLDTLSAKRVCDMLIRLRRTGCLDSREASNGQVADSFLAGEYTFCYLEPFVVWRARAKHGPQWRQVIGGTLPPDLGAGTRRTFLGGSLLAVLSRSAERKTETVRAAQAWIAYLSSDEVQTRRVAQCQYIPASNEAWNSPQIADIRAFYRNALAGSGCDGSPASLQRMYSNMNANQRWHPVDLADWPQVVEGPEPIFQLYTFWSRLRALPAGDVGATGVGALRLREDATRQALRTAGEEIDSHLSPGAWQRSWPWALALIILGSGWGLYAIRQRRIRALWLRAVREREEEVAQTAAILGPTQARPDQRPAAHHPGRDAIQELIRSGKARLPDSAWNGGDATNGID